MNKSMITVAVATALAAPMSLSAAESKFFGYSQITAAVGDGGAADADADGLRFGADSIRIGYKIKHDKAWGKLQLDFNKTDNSGYSKTKIGVPEIIKDAVVGYKLSKAAKVRAGVFKTPVGMDFSIASKQLDITKRGMDKGLVLERAAGLMVSGRNLSGFGYDFGVFNPAGRSSAAPKGTAGDAAAYAGRLMYDIDESLHLEVSYGSSTSDSDSTYEDYSVVGVAGSYKTGAMTFKAEYIAGSNVKGDKGKDESVGYIHAGYSINKMNEAVVRHYVASSEYKDSDTSLGNTYIGWNIFLADKKQNARIQLNYVVASGDKEKYEGYAIKGYKDNVFLAQFQVGF